jgi:hypothetical protein
MAYIKKPLLIVNFKIPRTIQINNFVHDARNDERFETIDLVRTPKVNLKILLEKSAAVILYGNFGMHTKVKHSLATNYQNDKLIGELLKYKNFK